MSCAAGRRCAVPDDTPGPPRFTNHQCRGVCGQYLHGNCGVVDPRGTSEMHRICHTCATPRESETSGAGTAGAQSEKHNNNKWTKATDFYSRSKTVSQDTWFISQHRYRECTTCLRWVQCSPTNRLSSGWSRPKVLTLAALCDMNNTLFLTFLAAVSWD